MVASAIQKRNFYGGYKKGFRKRTVIRKKPTNYGLAKRMNKMSRAISLNRKLAYGHTQRNLQKVQAPILVMRSTPVAFQATNFGTGTNSSAWQINSSGAVAALTTFGVNDVVSDGYWANQNNDVPDTGQYRALYANYKFICKGNTSVNDRYIRIDFIQPRPASFRNINSTINPLVLPYSLQALQNLCDGNMINPTYFKIICTKHVYINSKSISDNNTVSTTGNTKVVNIMLKINKNMYQSLSGTNFGPSNTSYLNQIWCVLSTNAVSDTLDTTEIDVHRHVVWRDTKGSAAL